MSGAVINLSDQGAVDNFTQINSKCILYYTAAWCGPCKTIKPVYEKLATSTYSVAFGTIDIDENADAAEKAQISSVPTFVCTEDAKETKRFSGADQNQLQQMVKELADKK